MKEKMQIIMHAHTDRGKQRGTKIHLINKFLSTVELPPFQIT